ncbi:uncharacterized protein I303_103736 [Kwoniella dejecticola CBS 10117]|uniref:Chromo domain-containing protein n=1 Tax=Kwoniella dejecticola CBS 10117 TaxID=1296121 RepID=A0A1A6A7K3_9TREE|nr:uncharacterized protein I303_03753 [Kwoniella dejecticola CBS 10117]OBR86036.1 hypothetical protein I303_03753 [Kwoniella dejecticola CBS 10117]
MLSITTSHATCDAGPSHTAGSPQLIAPPPNSQLPSPPNSEGWVANFSRESFADTRSDSTDTQYLSGGTSFPTTGFADGVGTSAHDCPLEGRRSPIAASPNNNITPVPHDRQTVKILGNITNLLIKQSQLISTNQDRLVAFEANVKNQFSELQGKIESVSLETLALDSDVQSYLKAKIIGASTALDKVIQDGNIKRRVNKQCGRKKLKPNSRDCVEQVQSNIDNIGTPGSSEAFVEDLIRLDTPSPEAEVDQFVSRFINHDLPSDLDPALNFDLSPDVQNPADVPENLLCNWTDTRDPDQTLVDKAVSNQFALLNGEIVLPEGENAVGFMFRKRLRGNRCDNGFLVDMSFLDDISIVANANQDGASEQTSSNLSSGVDSLPYTNSNNTPDPKATGHTYDMRTRTNAIPWNPFPLTYMREPTFSSITDGSSIATSDVSHLTSLKRGTSLVDDKLLLPGTPIPEVPSPKKRRKSARVWTSNRSKYKGKGKARGNRWPAFGANTVKSRMEEILCDTCGGRVHWACAGLSHGKNMREAPWSCPDCMAILMDAEEDEDGRMPSISQAQQQKCLRPDCIYRSEKKIIRKNDDVNEFFMERIVGRKRLHFNEGGGATFMYLIKWWDWEIYDATWEPAKNIPDLARREAIFLQQFKNAPDMLTQKVWLLDKCSPWFDYKGQYNIELLKSLGIEKRYWWDDKI